MNGRVSQDSENAEHETGIKQEDKTRENRNKVIEEGENEDEVVEREIR